MANNTPGALKHLARGEAATVLLFGPQALQIPHESIKRLVTLYNKPENGWMRDVVAELPAWTESASHTLPKLRATPAITSQNSLKMILSGDAEAPAAQSPNLPNALLTPLVVLDQLTQYVDYVQLTHCATNLGSDEYGPQLRQIRTLGLCSGMLSALAISSASTRQQFQEYASVAVRLAALIGALVDAEDAADHSGESRSLSIATRSPEQDRELEICLNDYPDAYISVNYDQRRTTITTSSTSVFSLQSRLRSAAITATPIGLRGRFHNCRYEDDLAVLLQFCDASPKLRLPNVADSIFAAYSPSTADLLTEGPLHHIALRAILVEQAQWSQTFEAMLRADVQHPDSLVVSFGTERCIPPSVLPEISEKVVYMTSRYEAAQKLASLKTVASKSFGEEIAVVGMACRLPGADDVEEFWHLNRSAKSQHQEVPHERFTFDTQWRETDTKRKWYGNFVRDHDAFDHKFFQKSAREATTQDPQQRILLESAYQAVEQSGYFNGSTVDRNVGVYIGVCAADYEANVACYPPNAFSATGNLKGFLAGKVSHYFGWHGPGLTIDTACSASAVAIHQACRAILGGECTAALAGGVNIMTSPIWFQNLAGATFLSPTGACKPFDAKADGYCRGEGIACVFLKKMSQAIADGDLVLGSIRSTAVYQNDNCTPIFVPNSPSLSSLFGSVVDKAGLQPSDISLVEAHGTGTPVGDPAEYESIRAVFGTKSVRSEPMPIGSVKGLIGHTECVSGVVALIKVILMIHYQSYVPQASFSALSPKLNASPEDMIEVWTKESPWTAEFRAALINNYGASGSNASMIVAQRPSLGLGPSIDEATKLGKHAFWLTGLDVRSIRAYTRRLADLIAAKPKLSLADLSFNIYRQSNRNLPESLIFSSSSVEEFRTQVTEFSNNTGVLTSATKPLSRPVILCFGGQISRSIGLDRAVYSSSRILRGHLDSCDEILKTLDLPGLYPLIFQKERIEDPVQLQTALFALQYSCAQCWIDSGLEPVAVVGHSFGELTALCVAGTLSLADTLCVITKRAQLVKDQWSSDPGAMMAVEGSLADVQRLITDAGQSNPTAEGATIACYNGPTSFTLAGTTGAIDAVEICIALSQVRGKRLSVSNAFHSSLVDSLKNDLPRVAADVEFRTPKIHWERATQHISPQEIGPDFFGSHMRDPVFASAAFERLHQKHPSAIWLEAGSASTITKMASKALGSPSESLFADINITNEGAVERLTDSIVHLWKGGLNISHWAHHRSQAASYSPIFLPPYQFERTRHWLELKKPQKFVAAPGAPLASQLLPTPIGLYTFSGYQDDEQQRPRFRVNTNTKQYEAFVSGHLVVQTAPICPATLEVDIAVEAISSLHPDLASSGLQPEIKNVINQAPICEDSSRTVWLDYEASSEVSRAWNWTMSSTNSDGGSKTVHVKGHLQFGADNNKAEFARLERLVPHQRCLTLLNDPEPDDVLQGRNVYKVFAEIVDYARPYQGLQKLVGKGNTSAGRVVKAHLGETWLDVHLSDCFSQVGGFWVNCMTERPPSDMYIAAGFESWMRRPGSVTPTAQSENPLVWDIMACHQRSSDRSYTSDIFIFEATTGVLHEVILGVNYTRIPKSTMSKTLLKLTRSKASAAQEVATEPIVGLPAAHVSLASPRVPDMKAAEPVRTEERNSIQSQIWNVVYEVLADLSGIESKNIDTSTQLADIGIDSLVGMELCHDLESKLDCSLDMDEMAEVVTVQDVVSCLRNVLSDNEGVGIEAEDGLSSPLVGLTRTPSVQASSEEGQDVQTSSSISSEDELYIQPEAVLESFGETKKLTDQFIVDFSCSGYLDAVNPKQTQLCISLIIDAFEKLGCFLRTARPGDVLRRIQYAPQHERLTQYLYEVLEKEGRLIKVSEDQITRTAVSVPHKSSQDLLDSVLANSPGHDFANRLSFFCGSRLVEVLEGKLDGVKLIFGDPHGRELVSGLYGDSQLNKLFYKQMEDFLTRLISRLPHNHGPLRILEMGAGTGGTTKYLVPLLARLGYPIVYTFTDLGPSFVAAARRTFKDYPFMQFRAHNIEHTPAEDLLGSQHLVIASNAVHATHSLTTSLRNMRKALRPDGLLMMLEMTETLPWVDIIFGLLEGWWLFEDGRQHAIAHETRWENELHSLGYGHVDWTDGHLPENKIQRILVAMASGKTYDRLPIPVQASSLTGSTSDLQERELVVNEYVRRFTANFVPPVQDPVGQSRACLNCILVTGATGSLGTHLVSDLTARQDVQKVICLNRIKRGGDPLARQNQSFADRGLDLRPDQLAKLHYLEADTAHDRLGLSTEQYEYLTGSVTAIIHNAWPMSGVRPVQGFEAQFATMRNLIEFASLGAGLGRYITFQFISSIAVVGHYPLHTGDVSVPEQRMQIESILPNGYGDAKYICELMLDETLHKYPDNFRTMAVRLGQIAGSTKTGYWNSMEHLSFLVKSSQTLCALPDFEGQLSWTPVNVVAATLTELALGKVDQPQASIWRYPIYHIDNPVGQPWEEMIPVLAESLDIPLTNVIPFTEWVRRVRRFPGSIEKDNPAMKLIDFLDDNFLRMSCGGLLLDTRHSREHSPTLAATGAVSKETARGYISYWKRSGFLAL